MLEDGAIITIDKQPVYMYNCGHQFIFAKRKDKEFRYGRRRQ